MIKIKKIIKSLINRKITVFKWQFNTSIFVAVFVGMIAGLILGIDKLYQIYALNDTHKVWTTNQANIGDYTYDSDLINVTSEYVSPGVNKLTNPTFDTDLSGWSGTQSYLLRDEFTDTLPTVSASDTFTRADGAIGNAETGGAWTGSNATVSSNKAIISPTLGSEYNTTASAISDPNGNETNGTSGYSAPNATLTSDSSSPYAGTYSFKLVSTVSNGYGYSSYNLGTNTWGIIKYWAKRGAQGTKQKVSFYEPQWITSSSWTEYISTGYSSGSRDILVYSGNDGAIGDELYFDNLSVKPLTASTLFASLSTSTSNANVSADVTVVSGTQAGVVVNLDSATTPQNYVVGYHDGTNAKLDKFVSGTRTNLVSVSSTYSAGAKIAVVKDGNSYSLIYNNVQRGTTQTISDSSIVNNTLHGLFSTYSQNTLDNFEIKSIINGTAATPGPGTRVATPLVTIGSGTATVSNGHRLIFNDSITREAGRVGVMLFPTSGAAMVGFASSKTTQLSEGLWYIYNPGLPLNNSSSTTFLNGTGVGDNNPTAFVARDSGYYYLQRISNKWILLYGISGYTYSPMYFGHHYSYTTSTTLDYLRVPTAKWLPTPLAYDTFTRSDGSPGSSEATGPDSQTTPSLSWTNGSIASNKLKVTPTLSTEILSNPTFEGTYVSGLAPNWSQYGNPTSKAEENTIIHEGLSSQKFITSTGTGGVSGTLNTNIVSGQWYAASFWTYSTVSNISIYAWNSRLQTTDHTTTLSPNTWTKVYRAYKGASSGTDVFALGNGGVAGTWYVDDSSIKTLTLSSLFSTVSTSDTDVLASSNIVSSNGTQAGVVTNLNDSSNPTNGIVAYVTRNNETTGATITVDKFTTATTWTNLIAATSVTYSAGAPLRIITYHSDANTLKVRVYYNDNMIGTEQTVTDAGIISNTKHGVFSTYSENTFDNFILFARGSDGEYNDIPADDLTTSYESSIKYAGSGSAKLVAGSSDANFIQSINVGTTSEYTLSGYAYTDGSVVTTSDLNLYYNSSIISTNFTSVGGGWYRISGTFTGIASSKDVGVKVKSSKTVYLDSLMLYRNGTHSIYSTSAYNNLTLTTLDSISVTSATPGSSTLKFQFCTDNGSTCESGNSWRYWNGSTWAIASNSTTHTNTASELTTEVLQEFPTTDKNVSFKAIMTVDGANFPTLSSIDLGMTTDITPPTNASNILMNRSATIDCDYADNCWTNQTHPDFEWTAGSDDESGLKGYCLYLGTDGSGDPTTSKGKLGTSPISISETPCSFIVGVPDLSLSLNPSYLAEAFSNSDTFITAQDTYFLNIKAIDNANNTSTTFETVRFRYDEVKPTNVSYITTPSGNFSNVVDMYFGWPTSGNGVSSDNHSGILGWQYQINTLEGTWKGTTHSDLLDIDYIPNTDSTYTLTVEQDGGSIISGNNVIYFRTVDIAGNTSSDATVRTGNIAYGGQAPEFGGSDYVTVSPSVNTTNSFSLEWPEATPTVGQNVTNYYYMVNTTPPSTLNTLINNASTYIDNDLNLTVSTRVLPNVNKGTNTVYVVAIDDASTPNYSPSNYISGTFTLNSTDPDNVGDLVATDSSIKSKSQWNVTLTWTAPIYQGAGNLTYLIYRSTDGINFSQVGTTNGLSYVDNTPLSSQYYYKIFSKDGADAISSGTNSVTIIPTGKWTEPAELENEPVVTNITTRKAVISWSTLRASDTKVSYGIKTGVYGAVEPSNSTQTTSHSIQLSGLNPNTTYYFKAKWTDEDGNTGISDEKFFTTSPAPTVKNITINSIGLNSGFISFTSKGASKAKIYYGQTTTFGGAVELQTSSVETSYTVPLTNLVDGTKYYFKINLFDSEGSEYDGSILDFTTLPRPKISNIRIQQVTNTAQSTLQVSWDTNTNVSSIVTYYPENNPAQTRDEVSITLVKGEHKMIIRGLLPQTQYILIVKGRDRIGNEAISDPQRITTATDTRPPLISGLTVEGSVIPKTISTGQEVFAQLIVSWNTDEPATSQVEFGEGTGVSYSQMSQQDSNLTYNHIVIISGLTPSKVYHLRAISLDSGGNLGRSIDTVTITPKSTSNALNLVISNLEAIFGIVK